VLGNASDPSDKDVPKSVADTYHDRETALRKLMDRNSVYNPDKRGTTEGVPRPDSVSLASFIGGRATGPRLNRHAPQPDAHDPTQYVQPDLSAPHPIFGTGGVALPGIRKTAEREKSSVSLAGSEMSERYRPSSTSALNPQFSSAVKHEVGKLDDSARQEKLAANRRSFTSLTQRYTDVLDKSTSDMNTKSTQPLLIKRKSGSIPKEPLLPSPTKGDGIPTISMSPSKSTSYPSSHSWKTSQSTPNPAPSYLRTKSFSSVPAAPTARTSSNVDEGLSASASNKNHETTPRGSTTPIPTYSLPRNGISSSDHGVTPLRRLMEKNKVYNPDKVPTDNFGKSVAERVQTTSLASFMGGSGKGIRLNKHAPQVDALDHTQFIQPDLSAPHPIFGKGGVAMPGMITQTKASNPDSAIDGTGLSKPSLTKKAVWPPVSTSSKTEERPVSPQKTGGRARTISAPRPESSSGYGVSQPSKPSSGRSRSPAKVALVGVPLRERTYSTPPRASPQQTIVTPSLARPIQPQVKKVPSLSPPIYDTTPSPAFNKATTQKDLTPSLSRLQGRGFVQNMVKASSRFSNSPSPPSASPSRPSSTTGRKGSVFDRWQPNVQESPTKSSPPLLSKNATTGTSTPSGSLYGLKSAASFSSLTKPAPVSSSPPKQVGASYPRSRTPGLGSATTTVVIKPSKSFTDLTELGIKTAAVSKSSSSRKTSIYVR